MQEVQQRKRFIIVLMCALFQQGSFQTVDIAMTCPSEWVDGQTARLTCEVLISRWTQPDPCSDSFSATVDFMFQPFRSNVETRECTVHTQSCNGELNPQGCSCSKNATHYKLHYVSKLNKRIHNKGAYACQPDCYDAVKGFNPLKSVDTDSCKSINFREPCDNNVCRTGSCSINNAEAQCSCDGTYYKGQRCEDDPCVGAGARTCYALKGNDNKRQCLTGFSGDKCEACGFGECGNTCKCTGLIVFLVIVVVIGTNSLHAYVTLARAKMVQLRPRPKGTRYEADARQEEPAHAQYQDGKATVGGKLVNQDEPSTVADDSSQVSSLESETDTAHDKDGKGNYGKK